MPTSVICSPKTIKPETLGPGDYFVGSHNGCRNFRNNRKNCYEINLHDGLSDREKKRRIGDLVRFIKAHPGSTFYFSPIGCGRGHVDREIVEHVIKPLVWLGNVRLPSGFLTGLLKDGAYLATQSEERKDALRLWHRRYSANGERINDPSFFWAAKRYGQDVGENIFGIISEYRLNSSLFKDDAEFKTFMTKLRDTLEGITGIPLPECLEGTTDRYDRITLGGRAHLYGQGFNKLPSSKPDSIPTVIHNLRRDLKDWVAKDENKGIFEKLDHLVGLCNVWCHKNKGKRNNYDTLPEEVLEDFKYFVTRFREFVDEVRKSPSA